NGLDGFMVPRADEHQGEYVADRSARLKWLTGFSGSAGVAIVLHDRAFVFVDGRYTLQVRGEVDLSIFTVESLIDNPPASLPKDKLARLAGAIDKDGATHAVLTDPSSTAWAFNIRGGDVAHTPLALGFAILAADGKHQLFMDQRKFSRQVAACLTQLADLHD